MKRIIASLAMLAIANNAEAKEYLIKLKPNTLIDKNQILAELVSTGAKKVEQLPLEWTLVDMDLSQAEVEAFRSHEMVEVFQPNYKIKLQNTWDMQLMAARKLAKRFDDGLPTDIFAPPPADNPEIPGKVTPVNGSSDPKLTEQWGMNDNKVQEAWKVTKGSENMIVAVIDTGVDYTHEDLIENMWRNPGEIAGNGKDDDNNGFIDDVVGWDFVSNDNKPYDFTTSVLDMLMGGGNPGHGTHCAGNVAARGFNNKGISGVAPNVKIMALRFLSEKGQGTTADAIKAVKYAVDNGARVLSNSWGSVGEDPNDSQGNQALRDVINYTAQKGSLFVAAAGNGDPQTGVGYDNDSSSKPAYPATYDIDVIVSVAAIDKNNELGKFSNWGKRSVDIGAPGVDVYSTMVNNKYSNVVLDLTFLGMAKITWDGTSMATPHVAGAAALYWSKHPTKTWQEVKAALLSTSSPITALNGKTVSGGKLNVDNLLKN